MDPRDRFGERPEFDPGDVADWDVLESLASPVQEWWVDRFAGAVARNGGFFTEPQRGAIPHIKADRHTLVAAPTGSGKTLAAFTGILDDLFERARRDTLADSVYCLYVSPLRSLANDVHRNLAVPLEGITDRMDADVDIRQAIRHGDTAEADRRGMLAEPPHVLNTTPETLAILLNSPKFREKLRTVEYVVVDEIHSVAGNKRGTHLTVSLERVAELAAGEPTRIGCSATVEPLGEMAAFLGGRSEAGGPPRDVEVVDARFGRDLDLELVCPVPDLVETPAEDVRDAFFGWLRDHLRRHDQTIVFTNTRSGAERILRDLRERYPGFDESNSACHHGSLSKDRRQRVETQLKAGTVDVVTTSTSLELGIDMPHVDLVVQVGSPKSVAALRQRVGRAGHQLGRTVTGRVVALERDELVECTVLVEKATEGFVDRVQVPENAQDVAAQHVFGMAVNGVRRESWVRDVLRRAYPYRNYDDDRWEQLLRYLTGEYEGLAERNVYPKVWRDDNDPPGGEHHHAEFPVGAPLLGKRGRLARMIYLTNVGTIPDSFSCEVFVRGDDEWVGQLDEGYLDTLEPGDVFVLGGERFAFRYRRGSKVYADRTGDPPTVPRWYSERLPTTRDLAGAVRSFQGTFLETLEAGGLPAVRHWLREFPVDERALRAVSQVLADQVAYAGPDSLATDDRLVVETVLDREEYVRHYFVHAVYGRRVTDGLSRLLAYRVARATDASVRVAVADNGFALTMPLNRKVDVEGILRDVDPGEVRADLRASLDGTDLLERYFRITAVRSLMVLKRYKGYERSAGEQQVTAETLLGLARDLPDFAVLEETYREILEDKLALEAVTDVVRDIEDGELAVESVRLDSPSPRAFGLATLASTDVVIAADESARLREYQRRVREAIATDGGQAPQSGSVRTD